MLFAFVFDVVMFFLHFYFFFFLFLCHRVTHWSGWENKNRMCAQTQINYQQQASNQASNWIDTCSFAYKKPLHTWADICSEWLRNKCSPMHFYSSKTYLFGVENRSEKSNGNSKQSRSVIRNIPTMRDGRAYTFFSTHGCGCDRTNSWTQTHKHSNSPMLPMIQILQPQLLNYGRWSSLHYVICARTSTRAHGRTLAHSPRLLLLLLNIYFKLDVVKSRAPKSSAIKRWT